VASDVAVSVDTIQKFSGASALAFGVAGALTPSLLSRTYGLSDDSPAYKYLAHMWGTRTGVLGALTLAAEPGKQRQAVFVAGATMNALDTLTVLTTPGLPFRTRAMAGLTSATFLAAAVYGLSEGA
jgi:hypothetical protein